jgi:flagella basal body P-ring formation protein FlgA
LGIKDHSFAVTTVDGIKLEGYEMAAAAAQCSHASFFIITAGVNRSADNIEAAYADSLQTFKRKVEMIALAVQRRQNKKLPETKAFLLKQAMERGDFVGCEPLDIGPSHAEVIMGEWGAISWGVAARDISTGQTLTADDVHFSRINYNRVPAEDRTNLLPRAAAPQLLGNIAQQDIRKGMYLTLKGFQKEIDPEQFVIGPKPKDHPVTTIA